MGKTITMVVFLGVVLGSGLYFIVMPRSADELTREASDNGDPRIVVEDLSVVRYDNTTEVSSFQAKLAHFIEPNIVEAFADIKAKRWADGRYDQMSCQAAHAQFSAENMRSLLKVKETAITYAEVEDQVRLERGDEILRTERAQYYFANNQLGSREPVQIDGPNRTFVGEQGFSYKLDREFLELPGSVRGIVTPDAK